MAGQKWRGFKKTQGFFFKDYGKIHQKGPMTHSKKHGNFEANWRVGSLKVFFAEDPCGFTDFHFPGVYFQVPCEFSVSNKHSHPLFLKCFLGIYWYIP